MGGGERVKVVDRERVGGMMVGERAESVGGEGNMERMSVELDSSRMVAWTGGRFERSSEKETFFLGRRG